MHRITANRAQARQLIKSIIRSYDSLIIRAYCRVRFLIMRIRFLEEMDQYLPAHGNILDLGCGFGLFSLYFACCGSERRLIGVDQNGNRIAVARESAGRLGLANTEYHIGDAIAYSLPRELAGAYMLDLVHHLPKEAVKPLMEGLYQALADDGILLVKDVDTHPAYKRWFTLLLDRLMVGTDPIRYWPVEEMIAMLEAIGFQVYTHEMRDILPYPHRLYICRKCRP